MVESGTGEWLWRPLSNPKGVFTTSFAMPSSVRGFGLMQRDRAYTSYEDDEARYELRPSAWITPQGDWGPGRVELVQLNTADESNDNIVGVLGARQVARHRPAAGPVLPHALAGRQASPAARGVDAAVAGRPQLCPAGQGRTTGHRRLRGPALDKLPADAPVKAVVSAPSGAEIAATNVYRNDATGAWRLAIRFKQRNAADAVELRAFLQNGNDILSETWSHVIPPR